MCAQFKASQKTSAFYVTLRDGPPYGQEAEKSDKLPI